MVLQADNGREFTAAIIKELAQLWPTLKLVNGRPRYPQSQGVVERANAELKKKIQVWMSSNNSKTWNRGIRFVQWQINTILHRTINTKPYKALFGIEPRCGVSKELSNNFFIQRGHSDMREEDVEEFLQGVVEDEPELLNDMQEDDLPSDENPVSDNNDPVPAKRA